LFGSHIHQTGIDPRVRCIFHPASGAGSTERRKEGEGTGGSVVAAAQLHPPPRASAARLLSGSALRRCVSVTCAQPQRLAPGPGGGGDAASPAPRQRKAAMATV